ncbi:MAG: OmpA family protein [Phyllobacteriaceae bacterium]|nr:OmpA family protein [Phyllobacteriaceae bacterium]
MTRSDMRQNANESDAAMGKTAADETIFRDPYAVLVEIAGGKGATSAEGSETGIEDTVPRPGMRGGLAYRDPFEPEFWENRTPPVEAVGPETSAAEIAEKALSAEADAATPPATQDVPDQQTEPARAEMPLPEPAQPPMPEPEDAAKPETPTAAEELAASIAQSLEDAGLDGSKVSVTQGEGSLIINMTDGADFSMFELGSARPKRDVVLMMERIAAALKDKPGTIEISGHTDARPFTAGDYDNLRLSSARAQMAYYMLARAGVAEARITAVTGHAERRPKNLLDVNAAENRRIEIRLVMPPDAAP